MDSDNKQFAVVPGASSGAGPELARRCLDHGFDNHGSGTVKGMHHPGHAGIGKLYAAIAGRRVDALLANTGRGLAPAQGRAATAA